MATGHRRAAVRLPRGQLARRHAEQPADPADDLPRPRRRDRGDRPAAGRSPAADPHGSRRDRQDAAQPRGCRARDAPLPGRRLVRGARDDHRSGPRAVDDRADARPLGAGRPDANRTRHRPPGCAPRADRPRQLRAGAGGGAIGERPPYGLPEPRNPDQQPKRAAGVGRAGVPGSAARPAGPGQPSFAVAALPVRGRRAVHRARSGGAARVRGHERERAGGRRDLRPPRRTAAGDRARRGTDPGPDPPGDARAARGSAWAAVGGLARPSGSSADPARRDRVEPRPARGGRPRALRSPLGVRRRRGAGRDRERLQRGGRRYPRRIDVVDREEPRSPGRGSRGRVAVHDARDDPRVRHRAGEGARPVGRAARAPRACLRRARVRGSGSCHGDGLARVAGPARSGA